MRVAPTVRPAIPVLFGMFGFFTPFSIAGAHISLSLAVAAVLLEPDSRGRVLRFFRAHPLAAPIAAWILVSILAVVFAVEPSKSFVKLKKLALLPLLPIGALPIVRARLRPILGALLASAAFVSVWGIVVYARAGGGLEARLHGISGFYMTVAGILMIVALLAIAELLSALKDPRPRRIVFLSITGGIVLVALLVTYTRGSWLGFAAGAVVLLWRRKAVLGVLAMAVVVGFVVGPQSVRDRAASIVDPNHPMNVVRIGTWKHGLHMVGDRPLTGAGLVIPQRLMEEGAFVTPDGATLVPHSHMHNAFLQIAVSMGLPALAVFLWLIVALYRAAARARCAPIRNLWEEGVTRAYPAILTALLVNGMFEWNFGDSEILGLLWFMTGAMLGIDGEPDS
jgi:O-antigen ligase